MKKMILLINLFFSLGALANTYKASEGQISFTAIGKPGFLKIKGESKKQGPQGSLLLENGMAKGDFTFEMQNLETGIAMRDEHMKEKYLEVKKFPQSKLEINTLPVSDEELKKDFEKPFSGSLQLHGVKKDVNGNIRWSAKEQKAQASFEIAVSDFAIEIPKYLGVTVSDKVQIEVQTILKK